MSESTMVIAEPKAAESMNLRNKNRILTADDVEKCSSVHVQVQAGSFNAGTCYVSYFSVSKEKLIENLLKFPSSTRYTNWCFEINGTDNLLEIPCGIEIKDVCLIIGEIDR